MYAAGILAGDEETPEARGAIGGKFDAAHHVVRGRHDLDQSTSEVEAAIGTALHHAFEFLAHALGTEMGH